jgi:hypothetical protein
VPATVGACQNSPVTDPPESPTSTWWAWVSLIPIGFGAWTPIYAGVRARVRSWTALGALWSTIAVAGWIASTSSDSHGHHQYSSTAGLLLIVSWVGAAATAFIIRSDYVRRMSSPLLNAADHAERRLRDRRTALELAQRNPTLAREMGVGRPDLGTGADAGLVDVNNAPAGALARLPGVDDVLATHIVETRAAIGGFASVEDLGIALDLPGDVVEDLRDRVVFLPR